jgi:hypothetical protein
MEINTSYLINCSFQQTFYETSYFLKCYGYLCKKNLIQVIFVYILFIGSIVLNSIILIIIILKRRNSILKNKKIFDSIILSQTILNLFNGLINIPVFHIFYLYKYWAFGSGNIFQIIWIIYYESIISIIILHLFYLTYARLRSVQNPNGFNMEKLIIKTKFVIAFMWLICFVVWIAITIGFGPVRDTIKINFKPMFLKSLVNLIRLFILLVCIVLSIWLVNLIYKLEKNVNLKKIYAKKTCKLFSIDNLKNNASKNNELYKINSILEMLLMKFNLDAKLKLVVFITINSIQW